MTKIWKNNPFEQSEKLWQISLSCKEEELESIEELFEGKALSFSSLPQDNGNWAVEIIVDDSFFRHTEGAKSDRQDLATVNEELAQALFSHLQDPEDPATYSPKIVQLKDKDWLTEVAMDMPEFKTDLFHILREENEQANLIPIVINNPKAFGMGDHETTIGCLRSIEYIYQQKAQPKSVMDIGTGTGILAIATKKLWNNINAYGIDIDKEAVRISREQALINNVDIEFNEKLIKYKTKKFDLIMANILANPLIEMAEQISNMLAQDGYLVISGFTKDQAYKLESTYSNLGLILCHSTENNNWMILTFRKKIEVRVFSS